MWPDGPCLIRNSSSLRVPSVSAALELRSEELRWRQAMTGEWRALLDDGAVFQRTASGQGALLSSMTLSRLERRFLAAVNGHTPLRVLMDLGFDEPGITRVIVHLVELNLIAAADPPSSHRAAA